MVGGWLGTSPLSKKFPIPSKEATKTLICGNEMRAGGKGRGMIQMELALTRKQGIWHWPVVPEQC